MKNLNIPILLIILALPYTVLSQNGPRVIASETVEQPLPEFPNGPNIVNPRAYLYSLVDMAIGDLDSDGDLDIISASIGDDRIDWYENDGKGNFSGQRAISTSRINVLRLAIGDLDGDGDLDILSASKKSRRIAWYRNDGSGNFGPQLTIGLSNDDGQADVAVADLDGDGDLDVISSATRFANSIDWYRNDGNGNFGARRNVTTAVRRTEDMTTADLDGDGHLDILSASANNDRIVWFKNDGNGNFGPLRTITTQAYRAMAVAKGDLDGDGDLDVLSASFLDNRVAWYRNDGSGNFGPQNTISTALKSLVDVTVADLDGDGDLDALSASFSDDRIAWYRNDGNGNFGPQRTITTSVRIADGVAAADLDGDNDLDVISMGSYFDDIAWYENTSPPRANCTAPFTLPLDANGTASITANDIDNGSIGITEISIDMTHFDCSHLGDNTVTLTVTNETGMTDSCTTMVTIGDTAQPLPDLAVLPEIRGACAADIVVKPTATDNCGGVISATTTDPLTFREQGTYTVTWTYDDGNGNTSKQQQTVIVEDVTPPLPDKVLLPDATGECRLTVDVPTATDNCSGTLTATTTDPLTYEEQGTFTVTWTFDDGNGNTSTQQQTVIVKDVTPPLPDRALLPDVMGECGVTDLIIPTATDNCTGAITATTTDPLTYEEQGTFTVTWTYEDGNGNSNMQQQTVIVEDVTEPIPDIDLLPDVRGECEATLVVVPTGTDNCAGALVATTTDPLTYEEQGTFTVTWTYDDGNGNSSTQEQNVIVKDTEAPVADRAILEEVVGECQVAVEEVPTATDSCSGTITATTDDPLEYDRQGTFTIIWTYDDGNGNTSTQQQTVIVKDTEAPMPDMVELPPIQGECGAKIKTVPTATDTCAGTVSGTTSDPLEYHQQGTYNITWTYDDGNGNTTTQQQTVIVEDVTSPLPDMALLPEIRGECGATLAVPPTATDNCAGAVSATTADPLSYQEQGTFTVTWTYDDGNGNTSKQEQTVIVEDVSPPLPDITLLPGVTGECGATVLVVPTATDNCTGTVTATTIDPLSYGEQGTYTVNWTYDDGNGNTSTQQQTVIVKDVTPPLPDMALLPDVRGQCGATVGAVPTATDNCAGTINASTTDPLSYGEQGTFTVTWTYVDGNGNIGTQEQTVIVEDLIPPMAVANDITVKLDAFGRAAISPADIDGGSADNCGIASRSLDLSTFECPPLAGTEVTLTVTDLGGNTASATATVTFEATDDNSDGVADSCGFEAKVYPNKGISPNGDGINDTWVIKNISDYPQAQIKVFDRNGREVFRTDHYANDWGATKSNGQSLLPVGPYYYVLHLDRPSVQNVTGWIYINY